SMAEHKASIRWKKTTPGFGYEEYNREHEWSFDAGIKVRASAAPDFRGKPDCVDPEEALVAALSGCHMLTFLAIASKKRLVVE
ncbi:OsmC family protein, partial [Salmonella enterica]|uniref:OsmC family protein n=1 Tax=Salmonella enterica TaxID=28901 RepID=UPI0032B4C44F